MNILILGSGGREYSIGLAISKENNKHNITFCPGNGATGNLGNNINITDFLGPPDLFYKNGILSVGFANGKSLVTTGEFTDEIVAISGLVNSLTKYKTTILEQLNSVYSDIKLPAFAEGGIVTKPTIGLIGEAGYPEAVIPLKQGIQNIVDTSKLEKELADLVYLTQLQANEIRKMRKEIQEMNERGA